MSPGVVKQSSTSSCCSALSWTSDASQHSSHGGGGGGGGGGPHGRPHLVGTPTHSGSIPYLPPPSYEKALQESQGAVLMRGQAFQDDDDDYVQQREDREDGYETLAMQPRHAPPLQHQSSSSASYPGLPGLDNMDVVDVPVKGPIILHKSSKALYRAVAAQWGITCKMNDHCRCLDCQSRYFDCDFDLNEEGKTDGGLGATSPIFLQEVMHGSACQIL